MFESVRLVFAALPTILLACLSVRPASAACPFVLNELMASNSTTAADPQNEYDDWIELHNGSSTSANAAGLYLTDDPENPTRWQIPLDKQALTTVPASGFLLIWADGETTASGLHAGFKLNADGGSLYLFDADGVTLLDAIPFDRQVPDVSYGRDPDAAGDWGFMPLPTPGKSNGTAALGVVSEVQFSRERGFYESSFDVSLTCETPGATIYYTTDGSEPGQPSARSVTGTLFSRPIQIAKTTCVRAIAVQSGWVSSPVAAQTFIFLNNAALQAPAPPGFPTTWGGTPADYEMDPNVVLDSQYSGQVKSALLSLPSMSIVTAVEDMFGADRGIYANPNGNGVSWERPGSVELIYPDGAEGFQVNCGVRIQGGAFRSAGMCAKHSFRLLFKGAYGSTKLRYPLFGEDAAQELDSIVLRAGANDGYAWDAAYQTEQYIRDEFGRRLQIATGNAAPRGTFVHLYVNGLYWGLYNTCERPDATFSASYYGGDEENWDAIHDLSAADGDMSAWYQMTGQCSAAASSFAAFQRLQGNNPDGTRNPAYPHLLDVPNYVDYLIVNLWGGNWDWPWKNWWAGRDRSAAGTGFKFYSWDYENTMGNNRDRSDLDKNALNNSFSSAGAPHQSLKQNAEYKLLFADRVHRVFFNDGPLTPERLANRYADLAATVELAMITESARWGDQHHTPPLTQKEWYTERDWILKTYIPQRTAIVLSQFRAAGLYPSVEAPVFYVNGIQQHGGQIAATDNLTMQATGAIWYTLDGSDPRIAGAAVGTSDETAIVKETAAKKVLVPTGPISDAWKGGAAFDDSAWLSGSGGVGFERSAGYEDYIGIDVAQMYNTNSSCYIRIPFTATSENLASFAGLTLNVRCDDGFVAYLNGTEIARKNFTGAPAWNSNTTGNASIPDESAKQFESFDVTTSITSVRLGVNLLAIQAMNSSSASSDFLLSAELIVAKTATNQNPTGISPTAVRYAGPITLAESACVKARTLSGATWSALNEAAYAVGPVAENLRISEIMYHPSGDPNAEYVELTNVGTETINLNLVRFTKGIEYAFRSFELPPGGYCLLVKDIATFEARYGGQLPVLGQYDGSLANAGEKIEMADAAGRIIESFEYRDDWFDLTDGLGFSLTVRDPQGVANLGGKNAWRPSAYAGGSPGEDDGGQVPEPGSVVINEVLANPADGGSDWIELHNTTAQTISIAGWYLSDDADYLTKYRIGAGTSIPAGGYIVFYQTLHFGNPADRGCSESFGLSKDGETVYLHSGSANVLAGYSEQEEFGVSEPGVSIGRWQEEAGDYVFVPMQEPTPGEENTPPIE